MNFNPYFSGLFSKDNLQLKWEEIKNQPINGKMEIVFFAKGFWESVDKVIFLCLGMVINIWKDFNLFAFVKNVSMINNQKCLNEI